MGTTESSLISSEEPSSWQGPAVTPSPRKQQQQQNGVPQHKQQPKPRPRPDVLKGILLGLPSSGKRTLLHRLQGKDPFDKSKPPLEQLPVHAKVTAPYKPPPSTTTNLLLNSRILLHVEIPHSLEEAIDFAVILVNPRHDPKHVAPYLANVIQSLLLQAGYPPFEEKAHNKHTQHKLQKQPLCLCILLNFRDLHHRDTKQLLPQIQESDLRATVDNVLKEYPDEESLQKHIVCGTTSLVNCYGLSVLHDFIYQSYLLNKKASLEQQLLAVQQALKEQSATTKSLQDYDEYVAALSSSRQALNGTTNSVPQRQPQANQEGRPQEHQEVVRESTKRREKDEARRERNSRNKDTQPSPQAAQADTARKQPNQRRGVMNNKASDRKPKPQTQQDSIEAQRSALEAFLAEDDDEDDIPLSARKQQNKRDTDDSSSDEEDDFYYDEAGARHGSHDGGDSSSDEEEEPKPQREVQRKTSQPRMPSISEVEHDNSSDEDADDKHRKEAESDHESATREPEVATQESKTRNEANDRADQGDTSSMIPFTPQGNEKHGSGQSGEKGHSGSAEVIVRSNSNPVGEDGLEKKEHDSSSPEKCDKHVSAPVAQIKSPTPHPVGTADTDTSGAGAPPIDEDTSAHAPPSPEANATKPGGKNENLSSPTKRPSPSLSSDKSDSTLPATKESPPAVAPPQPPAKAMHPDDGSSDDTTSPGNNNNDAASTQAKSTDPEHGNNDDQRARATNSTPPASPPHRSKSSHADDSSDDDFIVEQTSVIPNKAPSNTKPPNESSNDDKPKEHSPGMSAAALAAIAAAQEQAQLMLQQQNDDQGRTPKKKKGEKKKKKKRDDGSVKKKKKKKRDKEKKSKVPQDDVDE